VSREREVRLVKLNWDDECEKDFITGRGFEVTEKAFKGKEEKSMYGIHSPIFATDWEDEDAFAERYSCKCKELKGRVYEGEVCPVCNTEVKFRDVDLRIFGWIKLHNHFIIQPIFYKMLKSIIGDKQFTEIIEIEKEITRDGQIKEKASKTNPFRGIGLIEFKERINEILDYYWYKKKHKQELISEVRKDMDKVFTSSIPVYSSVLRPVSFRNETFFFNSIDRKYNVILADSKLLNNKNRVEKKSTSKRARMDEPTILNAIQKNVNDLWTLIFSQINQKDGHIKDQILGGRINFSARNVIIPDPHLRADEVRLGYLAFLELFKYEVIAYLTKMNNSTHNQAYEDWYKATIKFDAKIYEVMMYIVKKRKPHILINRNPTINYGSLLAMKVVDVKREYEDDYTMSLPIQILKVLNADFDGDILNIISLKTKKLSKAYDKTFNPRKNMYVSRNDGLFNDDFNLLKDQMIGLYEFNNI
jgi:DNA-directed RNA polymerase beta' subunit